MSELFENIVEQGDVVKTCSAHQLQFGGQSSQSAVFLPLLRQMKTIIQITTRLNTTWNFILPNHVSKLDMMGEDLWRTLAAK